MGGGGEGGGASPARPPLPLEPVPAELAALWDEALADAGFTRGDAPFVLFDGDPPAPQGVCTSALMTRPTTSSIASPRSSGTPSTSSTSTSAASSSGSATRGCR